MPRKNFLILGLQRSIVRYMLGMAVAAFREGKGRAVGPLVRRVADRWPCGQWCGADYYGRHGDRTLRAKRENAVGKAL